MNERQELEDEFAAQFGDPRRCPTHGNVTSSPDGMFDAPCGACEAESEQEAYKREVESDGDEFASWEFGISVTPESTDDEPF